MSEIVGCDRTAFLRVAETKTHPIDIAHADRKEGLAAPSYDILTISRHCLY